MSRVRQAFRYTVLADFVLGLLAALVETLAYTTGWFVPITWTIIEGSIAAPILLFGCGMLLGHFALPRFEGWERWAALFFTACSSAVLFLAYPPGSAAFGGIVAGGLFFVAEDRRKVRPADAQYTGRDF